MTNAELENKVRELMEGIGLLPPDHFIFDGDFHTCGVQGSPKSIAGRYKVHADASPTILVRNWKTGAHDDWSAKSKADMTPEERKQYNERIAEERRQAQEEQKARYARAAKKARYLWPRLMPATEDHPYLQRKMLPPGLLRQTRSGTLVLPILDSQGEIMTLQFINPGGEKRFLSGGNTTGGRFPIPSQDGQDTGSLLIGEGVATVASACLATGYAGEVAFTCGNLPRVARDARARWPGREIVILEDNDGKTEAEQGVNPGFDASLKAAQEAGARIAHCPAKEGLSRDFSDMYCQGGPEAVRKAIAQALEAQNVKDTWASNLAYLERKKGARRMTKKTQQKPGDRAQAPAQGQGNQEATQEGRAPHELPFGFYYARDGSLKFVTYDPKTGEPKDRVKVCEHVEVIGRTYGAAKWGYVLQWQDRRGEVKQLAIPSRLFARTNTDLAELLADEGLDICVGQHRRFKEFVLGFGDDLPIIRNVDRVGWFENCFVLPDAIIGAGPDSGKVILQAGDSGLSELYQTGGTLEGWQEMAALCAGNTRFEFALALAFSGPLLVFAPTAAGTIFSFCGRSTSGKSTALTVAASVWGFPDKQKRTWRVTDNGFESVCTLYNDNVILLDELGEVDPDALKRIAYMYSDGKGKGRANRDGGARSLQSWRGVALSSGEVSFTAKMSEAGGKIHAGQRVRFIDVPVASEHMLSWNGLPSAKALAEELSRRTMLDFGLAGRAFLARLVQGLETVRNELPGMIKQVEHALCPVEADAQVLRVAQRFALVCVGGQLAQEYNILPHALDVPGAVQSCFNDWLAARGSLGSAEEQEILKTIRRFIEQHGASRFQDEGNTQRPCINRVGFVRENDTGQREYFFFRESFAAEVAKGFELAQVLRTLDAAGWLKKDSTDRYTRRATFENARQQFYCVRLPDDGGVNE